MTRFQRLEKALRDDLSAMAEDFDSIMTNVDHSDLAWAVSQLHRQNIGLDYVVSVSSHAGEGARFARLVRDAFTQTNEEI